MPDTFLYTVATFDDETARRMKELERVLLGAGIAGRQTPGIPHHITLDRYAPACESEIKRLLRDVCYATSSFELTFSHIGLFGLDVLFLAPAVNDALLELHGRFHRHAEAGGCWAPHATLLIDEPDVVLRALPLIADNFQPLDARVAAVSLYEFHPKRFIASCKLQ